MITTASVPLTMEDIKEFYEDKEHTLFDIDYQSSELRGMPLVNYCANLELRGNIDFGTAGYAEKAEVVYSVLVSPVVSELANVVVEIGQMLVDLKGIDFTFAKPEDQIFTSEERLKFMTNNASVISNWLIFFSSMIIYIIDIMEATSATPSQRQEAEQYPTRIQTEVPHINHATFVGNSVVTLLQVPSFLEVFLSVLPAKNEMYYLDVQFKEYCYKRKCLYDYFAHEKNVVLVAALYEVFKDVPRDGDATAARE